MKTSTNTLIQRNQVLKNMNDLNELLEENNFSSWFFGFDKEDEVFFLSIFDEHNPQEELVFTVDESDFSITEGHRYKKIKRSIIKEEHIKYKQAVEVLDFIKGKLTKLK